MDKFLILNDVVNTTVNKNLLINQMLGLFKPLPSFRLNIQSLAYHPIQELILKKDDVHYIWITNFTHSPTIKIGGKSGLITSLDSHEILHSPSYLAPINFLLDLDTWHFLTKHIIFTREEDILSLDKSQPFDTYMLPDQKILYKNHSQLLYYKNNLLNYSSNLNSFNESK
jgi:hypothetical protein